MADTDEDILSALTSEQREKLNHQLTTFATRAVTYSGSELSEVQRSALQAYLRDYGYRNEANSDAVEPDSLSQFVSGEVANGIDSILPQLLSTVEKQPRFIEFESARIGGEKEALAQSLAVESVIRDKQLEAHRVMHDFAKAGLLYRIAVARLQWHDPKMKPFELTDISEVEFQQLVLLASSGEIELNDKIIKNQTPGGEDTYTVSGMRKPPREIVIQNLAPESILIPPYCETLDQRTNRGAPYVASREIVSLSLMYDLFPDRERQLAALDPDRETPYDAEEFAMAGDTGDKLYDDERRFARFGDEGYGEDSGGQRAQGTDKTTVGYYNEFLRYDLDEDGHAELLHIQRADSVYLNISEVEDNHFAWWCPFPIPHKAIGESLVDKLSEFQDVNTDLMRHALNATAMAIKPKVYVDASRIMGADIEHADTIDDLINGGLGAIIRTIGPPKDVVDSWAPGSKEAEVAFTTREMMKRESEERIGITPASRGGGGSTPVNRTAAGMAMGQQPGARFVGYIGDNFAEGLRLMAIKIRNMLRQGSSVLRVRNGNDEIATNPNEWSDLNCRVNIAGGLLNHQEKMAFLSMLAEQSSSMLDRLGIGNPFISIAGIRDIYIEQAAVMGFRQPERFFKPVDPQAEQQFIEELQNQPDPAMAKVEADAQARQAQLQQDGEIKGMQMQMEGQMKGMQMQMEGQMKMAQMEADHHLKMIQLEHEAKIKAAIAEVDAMAELSAAERKSQLEAMKSQIDAAMRERQQNIEAALEERQQNIEAALQEKKMKIENATKAKISGVRSGGKVG